MDAEERETRVGHWVDQVTAQVTCIRGQFTVFAAERHEPDARLHTRRPGQPVAVQPGCVDGPAGVDRLRIGGRDDPAVVDHQPTDTDTRSDFPARIADEFSQPAAHPGEIDDPRVANEQSPDSGARRLSVE